MSAFEKWRSGAELGALLPGYDPASLRRALTRLERATLLERRGRRRRIETAHDSWAGWNPAAGFLHFSTKDLAYAAADVADRPMERKARSVAMPPAIKRAPRSRLRVALPEPKGQGEFPQVLRARRTWRRFSREPVALADLATLLGLTFGVQDWMDAGLHGRLALKTSPSGGARHPLEAYVLARRVKGLAPGLYHYEPDRHRLALLKKGAAAGQIVRYLPTQWWYGDASALFLVTAVFPRSQWRYEFPRAYRAVLIEVGHLCQTLLLTATWLGLAPFCSMALADSRIERDLGVDGVAESVLYAAGVGARPRGVASAPRPPRRRRKS